MNSALDAVVYRASDSWQSSPKAMDLAIKPIRRDDNFGQSQMSLPFVYIAALRRSGSTMLAEALTSFPTAFIFREPLLSRYQMSVADDDIDRLTGLGVDLGGFFARHQPPASPIVRSALRVVRRPSLVRAFSQELVPELSRHVRQIGVKEIFNAGWEAYVECFENIRIVLTGRDPRDIYISLHERKALGRGVWQGELTPKAVAKSLLGEFNEQLRMQDHARSHWAKYEDLCTNPTAIDEVKAFVQSPIRGIGQVGAFNANDPIRKDEASLHGNSISNKRVNRWQRETNDEVREAADATFSMMAEYNDRWGYVRNP